MKKTLMIAGLLLATSVIATAAFAQSPSSPITTGLTEISVSKSGSTITGWDYEFTLFNKSIDDYSDWNVLVGELSIFGAGPDLDPNKKVDFPDPISWSAPTGWTWTNQGWKNDAIDFNAQKDGSWYYCPPSLEPGGSLSGFKLHYDGAYGSNIYLYAAHVFAVGPDAVWDSSKNAWSYTGVSVDLDPSIYAATTSGPQQTWWDRPGTVPPNPRPPSVPEASSLMLGALGLSPVGLAMLRKRLSK